MLCLQLVLDNERKNKYLCAVTKRNPPKYTYIHIKHIIYIHIIVFFYFKASLYY